MAAEVVAAVVVVAVAAAAAVVVREHCPPLSAEKNTMNAKHTMKTLLVALLIAVSPAASAAGAAAATRVGVVQQGYATPEDAAKALAEAVRQEDVNALLAVLGPAARAWLASGDPVTDRRDWETFLTAYDRQHGIRQLSDSRAIVVVGEDDWPFPAPVLRQGERWLFDSAAGREEILNRRIGRNELDTIQTLLAIVDAQREYAVGDLDGNGSYDYARRFVSSEGTRDGLFWPVGADEPASPLGPLLAAATREGYRKDDSGQPTAYHGYRYRMLTAQGPDAAGGAYSYLVDERMIGGFAVLAYPAKYGSSGIMSFLVNHDGTVFQKNLGRNTEAVATKLRTFNPGAGWTKVE